MYKQKQKLVTFYLIMHCIFSVFDNRLFSDIVNLYEAPYSRNQAFKYFNHKHSKIVSDKELKTAARWRL